MIIHLKRICLTVENAGDFLVIKFIIVAEIEYQPLLLRQSQYGFLELDDQLQPATTKLRGVIMLNVKPCGWALTPATPQSHTMAVAI